ncbi:hypothetical protein TYRP_020588 [Tyrophagus putrescentiae]|nr:hypothetical protein TYRP_020588 [Tyrophagus putrescentiae]
MKKIKAKGLLNRLKSTEYPGKKSCAAYLQHANRKSQITQPQPQLSEDNGKYPTLKKKKKKKTIFISKFDWLG